LLEAVEAAFDDVAALVALLLLITEVDRPARLLAPVRDLIVVFGDRGGDVAFPQPGAVRLGRVALVGEQSARP